MNRTHANSDAIIPFNNTQVIFKLSLTRKKEQYKEIYIKNVLFEIIKQFKRLAL